jgi:hypothetical protein
MDFDLTSKFFMHGNARKNAAIRFESVLPYDDLALKTGAVAVQDSFLVKIDEGKNFLDILWLQDIFNFSVSDRIHAALIEAGITGWHSYPLQIEGRDEKYWGIQVTGRAGAPIPPQEEGFTIGLHFDLATWDGSDMFILAPTMFTIFSQRLRDLLVKLKTTNLELEETSTMKWYSSRPTSSVP